jgi:hypothetical protein
MPIVSDFWPFLKRICEQAQGNCFDCFLHFWHVFWRFSEEWMVETIGNKYDGRRMTGDGMRGKTTPSARGERRGTMH